MKYPNLYKLAEEQQYLQSEFMFSFLASVTLGGADTAQCQEQHMYVHLEEHFDELI